MFVYIITCAHDWAPPQGADLLSQVATIHETGFSDEIRSGGMTRMSSNRKEGIVSRV